MEKKIEELIQHGLVVEGNIVGCRVGDGVGKFRNIIRNLVIFSPGIIQSLLCIEYKFHPFNSLHDQFENIMSLQKISSKSWNSSWRGFNSRS
jgi:hypothetical protein